MHLFNAAAMAILVFWTRTSPPLSNEMLTIWNEIVKFVEKIWITQFKNGLKSRILQSPIEGVVTCVTELTLCQAGLCKGQLILKGNFGVFNSSKRRT